MLHYVSEGDVVNRPQLFIDIEKNAPNCLQPIPLLTKNTLFAYTFTEVTFLMWYYYFYLSKSTSATTIVLTV